MSQDPRPASVPPAGGGGAFRALRRGVAPSAAGGQQVTSAWSSGPYPVCQRLVRGRDGMNAAFRSRAQ